MVQTVRVRFKDGAIVPLEPLDIAEGQEFLITLQDPVHDKAEAEDAGLARAIAEGLSTKPVSKQRVLESLQGLDGA
jgi:predicted DNA-binding antitoxin AbrB/MazE fold protein